MPYATFFINSDSSTKDLYLFTIISTEILLPSRLKSIFWFWLYSTLVLYLIGIVILLVLAGTSFNAIISIPNSLGTTL